MKLVVGGLLVLLLCRATPAADERGPGKAATPAEQYKTLLKQFQRASSSGKVLTDAQRLKFVGRVYKLRNRLAQKFIELAEKYPRDPIAVDALMQAVWQVNTTPWPVEIVGPECTGTKALALLRRDHIRSDKLGSVCRRISFGFCKDYEAFLRAVLAKSPHKSVRAEACTGLAHFLSNRLNRIDLVREQPKLAREFEGLYGKAYLAELLRQDRGKVTREAEALFEQAARDYADVKLSDGGTAGEQAKRELYELRHLAVGRTAPDIAGRDQDGKPFKLIDYRGKVVLLDFWSEY
jgi:hypothetical protein